MAIELEGLEFQIEAKSESGTKGVDALVASLNKLKNATKGGKNGLDKTTDQLTKLNNALQGFQNEKLNSITESFKALSEVSNIKIPPSFSSRIRDISLALNDMRLTDVNRLKDLSDVLKGMSDLKDVKISPSIPTRITDITFAISNINREDIEDLRELTDALRDLGTVGNVRIPRMGMGRNGNTFSPEEANEPRESGMSAKPSEVQTESISSKIAIFEKLGNVFKRNSDYLKKNVSDVELLKMKLQGLKDKFAQLEKDGKLDNGAGLVQKSNLLSQIKSVTAEIEEAKKANSIFTRLGSGFSKLNAGFHKIGSTFTALKSKLLSLRTALNDTAKSLLTFIKRVTVLPQLLGSRLANKVKQTTSAFGQFFSSLKRIAFYRLIRSIISSFTKGLNEGMKNLYQYSTIMGTDFAKSMDKLATSALYLKNSMGAMVSPIINQLAPAIDYVVDRIVEMLNVINQLIAKLSGSETYTAARKIPTSWEEAADKTKQAIDEIKRYTLGFDELNILGKRKSDSDSGSSDSTDYSSMFEELPIESSIGAFAERLKEMVKAGDWAGIGTTIGEKINEGINNIPWGEAGTLIGKGINGAVQTVYYLLDTVNFTNIGSKIALFLNNALAEIDFSFVGRMVVKPFTSLADLLIGVIETLDFAQVAKKLSDFIKGIFNEASDWVDSVDWNKLGKTLAKDIKDFIDNTDWAGIAESFSTFLGKAFGGLGSFFVGLCGDAWEDVKNWWNTDIKGHTWKETLNNLWEAIKKAIGGISNWVSEHIIDPFGAALFGDDWEDVKKAGEKAFDKFASAWENIDWQYETGIFFDDFGECVKETIRDALAPIDWGEIFREFITPPAVTITVQLVKDLGWKTVTEWVTESLGGGFVSIMVLLLKDFDTVTEWVADYVIAPVVEKVKLIPFDWESVTEWVLRYLGGGFIDIGIILTKLWSTVTDWVSNYKGTGEVSKTIGLSKIWNTVTDWVKSKMGTDNVDKPIGLAKLTYWRNGVGNWIKRDCWGIDLEKIIGLGKMTYWKNGVGNWIKRDCWGIDLEKMIGLGKSGWSKVSSWVKSTANWGSNALDMIIGLAKIDYWKRVGGKVSGWVEYWRGSVVDCIIGLAKSSYWQRAGKYVADWVREWVGGTVDVVVDLVKGNWSSFKEFFGLESGGYDTGHGFKLFQSGGAINGGFTEYWNSIPKYGGGTVNAHGTMFIAGEAGPEVVGHINKRTEVLNKSQLGQIMHASIFDGMAQFTSYWVSINHNLTTCANGIINAVLVSSEEVYNNLDRISAPNGGYDALVSDMANNPAWNAQGDTQSAETIADGVRNALYDSISRQNDLIREQNDLLRAIYDKDPNIEITANSIVSALSRKNQREGKTVIAINT